MLYNYVVAIALTIAGVTYAAEQPDCYVVPNVPGMGDNMFTMHFGIKCKDFPNHVPPSSTPDKVRQTLQEFRRLSNGMPFVGWVLRIDIDDNVRGSFPYEYEDTRPPWGDGSTGSGYRTYRELCRYAISQGGHLGRYLNPNICSRYCQDHNLVPDYAKALDKSGKWKIGWQDNGGPQRSISLKNMWDHTESNGKNYLLNMYDDWVNRWGANEIHSIHFDYYGALQCNNSANLGGSLTSGRDEKWAYDRLLEHFWKTYGISSGIECDNLQHGSPWSCMSMSGISTQKMIYMRNSTLGSTEWKSLECVQLSSGDRKKIRNDFYKYMLVYQYTQKTQDFTNSVQNGVTLYNGNDRFVPQVGAGCRIIAYSSKKVTNSVHALPSTWNGIASADIYRLTSESDPALVQSNVLVSASINLAMAADSGYVIVPHGYEPTPTRVNFDDLHGGDVITNYKGISWNVSGNPGIKVQARGPGSVVGGMGTFTIYMDDAATNRSAMITLPVAGILHSLRVGNKGGTGTITICSSNAGNAIASFSLPPVGQTEFIETNWQQSEAGNITITVSCSGGVANVLLDDVVYGTERAGGR